MRVECDGRIHFVHCTLVGSLLDPKCFLDLNLDLVTFNGLNQNFFLVNI